MNKNVNRLVAIIAIVITTIGLALLYFDHPFGWVPLMVGVICGLNIDPDHHGYTIDPLDD